jgi:predicted amino acid-binding ACT domain protein
MALKVSKVDVWAGNLRDVPGGLADALAQVAQGGESIQFLIARRDDKHTGQGKVFITPVTKPKSKDAAARGGLQHATNVSTLRVEGTDKAGLGSKITRAIAGTGVNMRGVSAAVIGGKFVAYLGFDNDADANAAMAALKAAKINGAASGKRAASRSKPAKRATKRPAARSKARR